MYVRCIDNRTLLTRVVDVLVLLLNFCEQYYWYLHGTGTASTTTSSISIVLVMY